MIINIPNIITIIRILLVPVFIMVFWSSIPHNLLWGMVVLGAAGATDVLDGYLARKFNEITPLGKVLDPAADKLMVITVLVSLYLVGRVPWWLVVLVLAKDLVLTLGSFFVVVKQKVAVSANIYGKVATVCIYAALFSGAFELAGSTVLAVIAAIISLIALTSYINSFINQRLC